MRTTGDASGSRREHGARLSRHCSRGSEAGQARAGSLAVRGRAALPRPGAPHASGGGQVGGATARAAYRLIASARPNAGLLLALDATYSAKNPAILDGFVHAPRHALTQTVQMTRIAVPGVRHRARRGSGPARRPPPLSTPSRLWAPSRFRTHQLAPAAPCGSRA